MTYKTWKAVDEALSDLEKRVGLPDFDSYAAEIRKAFQSPPTHVAKSIKARNDRLAQAEQDHELEIKSIKQKHADEAARSTPAGIKAANERRAALSEAVRLSLLGKDIASADAALESLIPDFPLDETVAGLCEDAERVASSVRDEENRKKTKLLKQVTALSAVASSDGNAKVVVSWTPESSGLATEYRVVRENLLTQKASPAYTCAVPPFEDEEVVLGMPYCYTVVPCYHGVVSDGCAVTTTPVVAVSPVVSFNVRGEGMTGCAVAHITWKLPAYDEAVQLSLQLERVCGGARNKIEVESCLCEYADEDVVVGETYRYELALTVSGRRLDPVVREVTIRELPELSPVRNLHVFRARGGMLQLTWEWPEDVDVVEIGAAGGDPSAFRRLTKIDYDQRGAFLSLTHDVRAVVVRSVRRFGTKVHSGPEVSAPIPESRGCVHWRICQQQTGSIFDRLRHRQYGVLVERGNANGEIALTVVNLTYDNATLEVMIPADRREVFAPFPKEFVRGDKIAVKVPTGFGVVCDSFSTIP